MVNTKCLVLHLMPKRTNQKDFRHVKRPHRTYPFKKYKIYEFNPHTCHDYFCTLLIVTAEANHTRNFKRLNLNDLFVGIILNLWIFQSKLSPKHCWSFTWLRASICCKYVGESCWKEGKWLIQYSILWRTRLDCWQPSCFITVSMSLYVVLKVFHFEWIFLGMFLAANIGRVLICLWFLSKLTKANISRKIFHENFKSCQLSSDL